MNTGRLALCCLVVSVAAAEETGPAPLAAVTLAQADGRAVFTAGGVDVATYHETPLAPPEGVDPMYARSGFVHPLRTPTGRTVTDDFPPDHAHQNGLFSTWTKVTFRGRKVDFWNRHKGLGTYRHAGPSVEADALLIRQAKRPAEPGVLRGPVLAGGATPSGRDAEALRRWGVLELVTDSPLIGDVIGPTATDPDGVPLSDKAALAVRIEHVVLEDGGETVALTEDRTYVVSVREGVTVIDVHSIQRAATDAPVVMEEHLYGGFAVRGRRNWTKDNATFLTSDGGDRSANHSRPSWVALSGLTPDGPATVAVVADAGNFRHPAPVRLHPEWPYFTFAACVAGPFTVERGRPLENRYRVLAFDGPADAKRIERFAGVRPSKAGL